MPLWLQGFDLGLQHHYVDMLKEYKQICGALGHLQSVLWESRCDVQWYNRKSIPSMFHWYHNPWDYFGWKIPLICFMQNLSGLLLLKDNGLCTMWLRGGKKKPTENPKQSPKLLKKVCFEDQKQWHIFFFFKTVLRTKEYLFDLRRKATVLL